MGEAKRRQESLGKEYGKKSERSFWQPEKDKLIKWTLEGLLIALISTIVFFLSVSIFS